MRLSTIDPDLAEQVSKAPRNRLKQAAIAACRAAVARIAPTEDIVFNVLQALECGGDVLPEQREKLSRLAQELDEIYFELTEAGDSEGALNAFSKARLYSAVQFALTADQPNQAAECIYEAGISLEEPDEVLDAAAALLSPQ